MGIQASALRHANVAKSQGDGKKSAESPGETQLSATA
jgi:hypothetical protein